MAREFWATQVVSCAIEGGPFDSTGIENLDHILSWLSDRPGSAIQALNEEFIARRIDLRSAKRMILVSLDATLFADNKSDPKKTLGLVGIENEEEVKRRYRRLMQVFHPDRIGNQNAKLAGRAESINKAFTMFTEHGWGKPAQVNVGSQSPVVNQPVKPAPIPSKIRTNHFSPRIRSRLGSADSLQKRVLISLTVLLVATVGLFVLSANDSSTKKQKSRDIHSTQTLTSSISDTDQAESENVDSEEYDSASAENNRYSELSSDAYAPSSLQESSVISEVSNQPYPHSQEVKSEQAIDQTTLQSDIESFQFSYLQSNRSISKTTLIPFDKPNDEFPDVSTDSIETKNNWIAAKGLTSKPEAEKDAKPKNQLKKPNSSSSAGLSNAVTSNQPKNIAKTKSKTEPAAKLKEQNTSSNSGDKKAISGETSELKPEVKINSTTVETSETGKSAQSLAAEKDKENLFQSDNGILNSIKNQSILSQYEEVLNVESTNNLYPRPNSKQKRLAKLAVSTYVNGIIKGSIEKIVLPFAVQFIGNNRVRAKENLEREYLKILDSTRERSYRFKIVSWGQISNNLVLVTGQADVEYKYKNANRPPFLFSGTQRFYVYVDDRSAQILAVYINPK